MTRAAACMLGAFVLLAPGVAKAEPALIPQPRSVAPQSCRSDLSLVQPLLVARDVDAGGVQLLDERWRALGIAIPRAVRANERPTLSVAVGRASGEAYRLLVRPGGVRIAAASPEGAFDALMTLAQLPERAGGWHIACVDISDAPALRWRIVSDDVSRGPFPTTRYAEQRIRTLAALKINGWSPYMEQVVVDPRAPFVASPNGWTTAQLHALATYARRYWVTLIPEQQTFAHLHEVLKWEVYAPLAELPHGYLLAESDPRSYTYLGPLVRAVAAAAAPIPFFHIGADEPLDLGRGRTPRTPQVFADHVTRVARFLPAGVRPVIWDDAIQQDHTILTLLPRDTIVAAFHYGVEPSYRRYLDPLTAAGFASLVAPGAANWNEIYPDLATSYANVARFVADGRATPSTLGMLMTVWHDDGETLYEATWPAVAYAAASAWQRTPVDDARWHRTFARAFFGSDDPRYAAALDALRDLRSALRTSPSDPIDYVFWHDPFDPRLQARAGALDLAGVRTRAEDVMRDLWSARPPLQPQAVAVMELGAMRYDQLARRLQIGKEARDDYDDARAAATTHTSDRVYRSLGVAKYLCWELRDALTALAPRYAAAWRYESTEPGLRNVLVRYDLAEADAQRCADRIDAVMREDYLRGGSVPEWNEIMK